MLETVVYAARLKEREKLKRSSSGGMFIALSEHVLLSGGAVACAVYNYENHSVEYQLLFDPQSRDKAVGSKYMQSKPEDVYTQCLSWIKENPTKKLLFVGMGCQAAGFKKFIENTGVEKNVYVVYIICHGSPSNGLWRDYILFLEKQQGSRIHYITFKDKRISWIRPAAIAVTDKEGKELSISDYVKIFYSRCALRPSCHVCPYAVTKRNTDMTIGDFWGIDKVMPEFYDPMGNSLVLIHSEKGLELFDTVKNMIDYTVSTVEECLQPNLIRPTIVSEKRSAFWNDYRKKGIEWTMKKYGAVSMVERVKNKLKKIGGGTLDRNYRFLQRVSFEEKYMCTFLISGGMCA